jgi:hypothetical protein
VRASYQPSATLEEERVVYVERILPASHSRIARRARERGATFSELVASALLSGMHRYNSDRSTWPPPQVGLMFARARPRTKRRDDLRHSDASFRADTCVVSAPSSRLATAHHPATLAGLRRAARDKRHNDLALAALYATRKVRGKDTSPALQSALHFTLSDLTAFGRASHGPKPSSKGDKGRPRDAAPASGLPTTGIRVLASPTSFDHAGVMVSRSGDDVSLCLIAHRGALDAGALLDATVACLEES